MTTELTIESLGLTKDDLADRVVARIVDNFLSDTVSDEDGESYPRNSEWHQKIENAVLEAIDGKVAEIATKHIEPAIGALIDAVTFQETSRYGEPKAPAMTFKEFLEHKANTYFTEPVNFDGKSQKECSSYTSFSPSATRVVYLIQKHLHYTIENTMKGALVEANRKIVEGIEEAVKIQCADIAKRLSAKVVS